ncbi:hypothetical protein QQZ08_010466 [Neonectria magnoliae]|uniref:Calcineurin-like phosphoesterase domain-containing protein n=1 Tax=Neonectria magnoliae TaxID=2732573 RepID=A0ABR1HHW6_9HYPO
MSDLHLELNRQYSTFDFPVKAPLLALGGDIGRLVDYEPFLGFLARQTARFDKVFLVLGNHELYEMSYDAGIEKALLLEKEEALGGKLVLMHRNRWDDPDSKLTILGCTPGPTSRASRPEHEKNPWKTAFSTDVLQRREFARVAWWMFGHTHFTTQFQRGRIRVVANQRGYVLGFGGPTLENTRGFDAERVVDL